MRSLITIFALILMTNCSVFKKNVSKEREKVEVLQVDKSEIKTEVETNLDSEIQINSTNQLISLLSAINWEYAGKDSAEIEIIQTKSGIKVKTRGSGTAYLEQKSEIKQETKDSTAKNRTEFVQNNLSKIDKSVLTKSSSEKVQKEKETKRWDFSIAFWIVLAIILIVLIVVYALYKRSGGTKFFENRNNRGLKITKK